MLSSKIRGTKEIVKFLKRNYQQYEEKLISVLDLSSKGFYFISEDTVYFSSVASKILNLDSEVNINEFIERINEFDREQFQTLDTTYELTYRYNISNDKILWIKEHGLFDFKNKNQRLGIITNYTNEDEKLLHRLAYYDSVTNLKNRNYFDKDAMFLIQYKIPFALFFLDLNSFKLINDNFGHSLGDSVLRIFSEKLKECIKYENQFDIYRISGDEFFVLLPYLEDKKKTEEIVRDIVDNFNEHLEINDYQIMTSPSIGIAFYPSDSSDLETLIKYADISMYQAKSSEINRYCFFEYPFYKQVLEERSIEEHIKYLIDNHLITLFYQPIFDIKLNKVISYEALFNSNSSFTPDKIFNTALKSSLIILLDKYIIEQVIKNISEINKDLHESTRFTINITPKTFYYEDIYEYTRNLLNKYQVSGKLLGFELTEQHFIHDENKLNETITKLQSIGIHIYLDDFGMGYSSIRNLMYLKYDHIKLDRRLIGSIFTNPKCATFLKTILKFSAEFYSDIIFEGVETKEELDFVKEIGGSYVQGYYYSKPLPFNEALKLLKL